MEGNQKSELGKILGTAQEQAAAETEQRTQELAKEDS